MMDLKKGCNPQCSARLSMYTVCTVYENMVKEYLTNWINILTVTIVKCGIMWSKLIR